MDTVNVFHRDFHCENKSNSDLSHSAIIALTYLQLRQAALIAYQQQIAAVIDENLLLETAAFG